MEYKITVLPGDGIGPEVIDESVKVLEAVGRRFGHDFDLAYGIVGGRAIDATGSALPDETIEMCLNSDAVLFGAVGGQSGTILKPRCGPKTVSSQSASSWDYLRTFAQ